MRRSTALIPILLSVLIAADAAVAEKKAPGHAGNAARANNAFALDLYGALRSADGNLFFSPYSVSTALAMTREGARGETAAQMRRVFHWTGGVDPHDHHALARALLPGQVRDGRGDGAKEVPAHQIHVANALWAQEGIPVEKPFADVLADRFRAPLERLDFRKTEEARAAINGWVEEHTKERIKDIVPEGLPTADTLFALANAIWFKAAWHKPFEERWTKVAAFTTSSDEIFEVSLMHRTGEFRYAEDDDVQVVEIDYRGHETSMVVVLPRKRDGLPAVEAKLDASVMDRWLGALAERRVSVKLPEFEVTQATNLTRTLAGMGMPDAFDGKRADFTGMFAKRPLFIGVVLHKAFVKVDEAGTEAAAATVVSMRKGKAPGEPVEFTADHPFIFVIRHRATGCILFMGRVADPTE